MEAMYTLGLSIHSITTALFLAVLLLNFVLLYRFEDIVRYKRLNSVVMTPLTLMIYSFVVFTGVLMMAAKRLDFTTPNSVMVVLSVVVLLVEIQRIKTLRFIDPKQRDSFVNYKGVFMKMIGLEIVATLFISLWMWVR